MFPTYWKLKQANDWTHHKRKTNKTKIAWGRRQVCHYWFQLTFFINKVGFMAFVADYCRQLSLTYTNRKPSDSSLPTVQGHSGSIFTAWGRRQVCHYWFQLTFFINKVGFMAFVADYCRQLSLTYTNRKPSDSSLPTVQGHSGSIFTGQRHCLLTLFAWFINQWLVVIINHRKFTSQEWPKRIDRWVENTEVWRENIEPV